MGALVSAETKLRKEVYLKEFKSQMGNVYRTAKATSISRKVFNDWMQKDAEFAQQVKDVYEGLTDNVVHELYDKIFKDHNIVAILYYLKTRGKSRGFGSDTDINYTIDMRKVQKAIQKDIKLHEKDY